MKQDLSSKVYPGISMTSENVSEYGRSNKNHEPKHKVVMKYGVRVGRVLRYGAMGVELKSPMGLK